MERVIERAMHEHEQWLPARITDEITDWLDTYCLVTIFRVLILSSVGDSSSVQWVSTRVII